MDRKQADALLKQGRTGSFFVRESANSGGYALSFRGPRKIQHFPIEVSEHNTYICGGRTFDALEGIILRYINEPLMDETKLQFPVPPDAGDDDDDTEIYSVVEKTKGFSTFFFCFIVCIKFVMIYRATKANAVI